MADCWIMLNQLVEIFDIPFEALFDEISKKKKRLADRIQAEKGKNNG
jgi:hypothetical protein